MLQSLKHNRLGNQANPIPSPKKAKINIKPNLNSQKPLPGDPRPRYQKSQQKPASLKQTQIFRISALIHLQVEIILGDHSQIAIEINPETSIEKPEEKNRP